MYLELRFTRRSVVVAEFRQEILSLTFVAQPAVSFVNNYQSGIHNCGIHSSPELGLARDVLARPIEYYAWKRHDSARASAAWRSG